MRDFSTTARSYLAARRGVIARAMIWAQGWDRATGAAATVGFWTGDRTITLSIGGEDRTYIAAGAVMSIEPIRMQTGVSIVTQRATLSMLSPEVLAELARYDIRFAPVEIHRALLSTETWRLIEEPHRLFKGFLASAKPKVPAFGKPGGLELTFASASRDLTLSLPDKRSDQSLRARASTDTFRAYADVAGKVKTPWGKKAQKSDEED